MAGHGWQELFILISLAFWGGVAYLGYRVVRWFMRRERQDRVRNDAEFAARIKQEVLAELETERAAGASHGTTARAQDQT
jgi:hypothetical protein